MDVLQTWIVFGVPGLLLAGVLFVGNSQLRALGGYAVLLATLLVFVLVPGEPISAAVIGAVLVVFVANGRGQGVDDRMAEHHEHRERFTVARGE
jgi:hypothetical protein